jgi:amino acid adenylation domain-containing protein
MSSEEVVVGSAQRTGQGLGQWLRKAAKRHPQRPALESPSLNLSYAELLQAVDSRVSELRRIGLGVTDRVAIAATRSHETIVSILAAVDAGIGYVPLDLGYPPDRLNAMLEDSRPRLVLGAAEVLQQLRGMVGDFPTLEHPAAPSAPVFAAAGGLAYVLFTSGSTGRPKGVAMGCEPLEHLIEFHARHPKLGSAARTLQFAPLSFDVHFQEILSSIACGGTLVLVPEAVRRDPALLHAALCDLKIERIFLPYVALQMIAEASRERVPEHLREVVSAGEQLQVTAAIRWLFQRLPQAELHNHYGPTESHVVTAHELTGDVKQWPDIPPIGVALPHVRLALRDPETGAITQALQGELLLGGQTLANGYLGREDLTLERFRSDLSGLPGRWYCTGDLVRRDAQGIYTYLGRSDQQLKVDGFRIEPGEIEVALMAHAAVKDAVVTAPEVPGVGRQLIAHLVLRERQDPAELALQLRTHLRTGLPEYMIPVRYIALERLPTTPSGKIDRRALPLPQVEAATMDTQDPAAVVRGLWQELLGQARIGDAANVFDLGARSLLVLRFVSRLKEQGLTALSVADVYDRPTIGAMVRLLQGEPRAKQGVRRSARTQSQRIAIVGMATRTAGAADLEAFWDNLLAGKEGIRHFTAAEIDASVPDSIRSRPNFVAARGALEDADCFDATFFGISAREATVIDPQQRLLLELSWTALEHAAIDPAQGDQRIGVYAGTANNTYIVRLREEQPELVAQFSEFATMLASEKDYVATRIAHRLNLNGPAVSVHTACSTGLVAVAEAWHALASGRCDVALAGGATVIVPQESGYLHVEGGMESADGHCRPFDADASGTVFASGGAVVVLKRLEDAITDGDTVYAVIRGVGLNNDGADKASFTAPSVTGQASAIRMALEHADVDARSIGYVETHGTGTSLGDPIEIAAITRAWREHTADNLFCGIGSLKSNLGHTIAAAGVLGLVKVAMSLHRQMIPKTLHYRRPNPQIDFSATPFRVIAENTAWQQGEQPRRAAVSSFGVGGTNAHLVVEAAPADSRGPSVAAPELLVLPLSARTPEAAVHRAHDLAAHLERHPQLVLADVAATLMRGRREMASRVCVAARDVAGAITALRAVKGASSAAAAPRLVFLFPGQGSQHPGMARQLYDEAPAFRTALDQCLDAAGPELGSKLMAWLVQAESKDPEAAALLSETRHAQPALFAVEYALAAWLDSLGVRPDAMIGHSIGEYAAACHAGVMSVADAMAAVIARGTAMFEQPRGAMLAVKADSTTASALLPVGVEIAGNNAPNLTVVAGPADAIDALVAKLDSRDIGSTRLRVSHAFHSATMEGALPKVAAALQRATLKAPQTTMYSCVSGAPLQAAQAQDPGYWANQVRATVQFSRAVQAELAGEHGSSDDIVFVEVGPSQALSALIRQHRTRKGEVPRVIPLLGPAQEPGDPALKVMQGLGALWCAGIRVGWPVPASAQRIALPTYRFKRDRYWFVRRAPARALDVSPTPVAHTAQVEPVVQNSSVEVRMSRLPTIEQELRRVLSDVSGVPAAEIDSNATFIDQGLDSLSLTQATLEMERVFGVRLRFRRLLEDLDTLGKLAAFLDAELPADKFAPPPPQPVVAPVPHIAMAPTVAALQSYGEPIASSAMFVSQPGESLLGRQLQLIEEQLRLVRAMLPGGAMNPPAVAMPQPQAVVAMPSVPAVKSAAPSGTEQGQPSVKALLEKPFGASARITLDSSNQFSAEQRNWLQSFIARYNSRTGKSKEFSQANRKLMGDPRVVTGFNPLWKDLVYPIVVNRSKGARLWDLDGNEYIDLLSAFGANLLGYQPDYIVQAMTEQLNSGIEVGPQHPLAAEVAQLISEFTGMERVAFCNTGSEAVMGAMRIARTVTGRKTIAIFTNSYHGIFDEVIVRGTKQLRSLSAAPGILANAVENVLVLDYPSDESLRILRERGKDLAAIMIEPIQNKYPTLQPREFVRSLREIADAAGCALIFDEVVTGFRVAPGGAQEFYGVRADIATFGKVIGGGLPFAAIGGSSRWLDALDGGHWSYGDDSYPEAGVTYFAGTFVRHPLALAAARASLLHLKRGGRELYRSLNAHTQGMVERLNAAFKERGAPVKAVHCASLWRLSWDEDQKNVSLFYYLVRYHGLHLYEQFGHFVTEAFGAAEIDKVVNVFLAALDELMGLGFITPREGTTPPKRRLDTTEQGAKNAVLAPGQTERWLAASFDASARRALNESFCVGLRGDVDLDALKGALRDVLMRHEAFRVEFSIEEPAQRLAAATPIAIEEVDLRNQPEADAALDAFCTQASLREFVLDRAPLAAASILHLADGRVVVHVVASHLIFDGWASSVFNAELAEGYRARCRGASAEFKAAESPLAFAAREQQRFAGRDGQESLAYWTKVLANPPKPLSVGDLTPAGARTFAADTVRLTLEGDVFVQLRSQARQAGATLFQLLLTAVTLMLQRRSGQDDFVISIPYASQSLDRHGPLIADGVLDLPLRVGCSGGESPASVLARVRSRLMDALEYPVMTQGTVARALGIRSSGDRPPLTGVFFNLNPRVDVSGFAPLVATMHEGRKRGSLNELFFNFYEKDAALSMDLHYSSEFCSVGRARQLVAELRSVCLSLAQSLSAVPTFAADETAVPIDPRLLKWNSTEVRLDSDARIERWVARQARSTPHAIALESHGCVLTYEQLEARANRFGNVLHARGIGAGDLVGLCMMRGPDLVPALLGVLKTGAAYVPLDPGFPRDRLQYMAEDAGVKLVITEAANAELSGVDRQHQICIDDDAGLIAAASANAVPANFDGPAAATAYVIYTSGSTGKPKGVVLPQHAVCNFLASMRREPGLTQADRLLAVTTLSFDIAVLELLLPLTVGARIVLAQREQAMDGEVLGRMIAEHGITIMQATPTTWHMLLEAGWRAPSGFRALCGGEALPASLAARLLEQGIELWNMYGPTETTVWSTLSRIHDAKQRITVGRPIDNTQVWILDEQRNLCGVGLEGEICIGGLGVATGYFKRPELTAEKFVRDPFASAAGARVYRTGDLGRWREDGTIEHLGRLDFQVKIRGYRIELGEIEARIDALHGVAQSVVIAREDSPGDVRLVGYCVANANVELDPLQMRESLRKDLPDYMLPQSLVVLESLPLLPNGKINRKALPAPASVAPAAGRSMQPPRTDLERTVAAHMQSVLKIDAVGVHDDFFSLGGHSLLAARLVGQINRELGLQLGLRTLFESPSVEKLALAIEKLRGGDAPAARPAIARRPQQQFAPLTLMQQRIHFVDQMNPGGIAYNAPSCHRFNGQMDVQAFDRAFSELIRRQAALRTAIEPSGDDYVQHVREDVSVSLLPLEDLSGLPQAQREKVLLEQVQQLADSSFSLDRAPLFKARLFKLQEQEHAFFFMPHHVVWDGWSFDIFYADMSALYEAFAAGRPAVLPELSVSYGDFAEWHNAWLGSDEIKQQVNYWKQQFARFPTPKEPYHDWPRRRAATGRGATEFMHIAAQEAEQIRDLAKQTGSTLSIVALAIYSAMMSQWLRDPSPAIGLPVRGRPSADLEGIMGFFNNMVPMRLTVMTSLSCLDWIRQVRQTVTEIFANQDVPFEMLAQESSRLYQVMFSFQDARDRQTHWGDLAHSRIPVMQKGATEDINLWLIEIPDGIEGGVQYNADLFLPATAAALRDRFIDLLRRVASQPAQTVDELLAIRPQETSQLEQWNRPATALRTMEQILGAIAHELALQPQRIALRVASAELRNDALLRHISDLEATLRKQLSGVLRDDRKLIAIGTDDPLARVISGIAALRCGARLVFPSSADTATLASPELVAVVLDASSERSVPPGVQIVTAPGIAASRRPAVVTTEAEDRDIPLAGIAGALFARVAEGLAQLWDVQAGEGVLCSEDLPPASQFLDALIALSRGAQLVFASSAVSRDPTALQSLLDERPFAVLDAPAGTIKVLCKFARGKALPRIFQIQVAESTASCTEAILAGRSRQISVYRPSALGLPVAAGEVSAPQDTAVFGSSMMGSNIAVLDRCGRMPPPGVAGELHWQDVSAAGQGSEQWHATGSLVRWRSDGVLQYLGEQDRAVYAEGHWIDPAKIERALATHPALARAVVTALFDADRILTMTAHVEPQDAMPQAADLTAYLAERVPPYAMPQHFIETRAWPMLANGAIDHTRLTAGRGSGATTDFVAPRNDVERAVAEIWRNLLGVAQVSVTDNFFLLGGHSLLAVKMLGEIERRFNVNLPLSILLRRQTCADLCDLLAPGSSAALLAEAQSWRPLVQIQAGNGERPPVFCIHAVGGNVLYYRQLSDVLPDSQGVYGLQSVGLDGVTPPLESIPQMAERYRAEIRSVQPTGPYFLCGGSMGGTIAFEMARQYEAEGELVALLALFDTSGPALRVAARAQPVGVVAQLASYLKPDGNLHFFGRVQRRLRRVADDLLTRKRSENDQSVSQRDPWQIVEATNFRALATYSEGPYGGRVTLFRALDEAGHRDAPPDLCWGAVVSGGVEVIPLPGTHAEFIEQPELQRAFRDVLLRTQENLAAAAGKGALQEPDSEQASSKKVARL